MSEDHDTQRSPGASRLAVVAISCIAVFMVLMMAAIVCSWNRNDGTGRIRPAAEVAADRMTGSQAPPTPDPQSQAFKDAEADRHQMIEGKYWLEMAGREEGKGNHLTSAMMAGRALGFDGLGAESDASAFPRFLMPRHGRAYQRARELALAQWNKSPMLLWRSRNHSHHGAGRLELAFSPDGSILASREKDSGSIHLWDMESGDLLDDLIRTSGEVSQLMFSPDGGKLAYLKEREGVVCLYDLGLRETEIIRVPKQYYDMRIAGAEFHPRDRTLMVYSTDAIMVWDFDSRELIAEPIRPAGGGVRRASFDRTGRRLVTMLYGSNARIWNYAEGELSQPIDVDPAQMTSGEIDSNVEKSRDQGKKSEPNSKEEETPGQKSPTRCFFPDDDIMATRFLKHPWIDLWNLATGEYIGKSHQAHPYFLHLSSDGSRWIGVGRGNGATMRILMSDDEESGYELIAKLEHAITDIRLSPDMKRLAVGCGDGMIRVLDMETGQWIGDHAKREDPGELQGLLFKEDGRSLVSRHAGGAKSWQAESGRVTGIHTKAFEETRCLSKAISKDGRLLALAQSRKNPQIFVRVAETGELRFMKEVEGWKSSMAISDDNRMVAVTDRDGGPIRVWDIQSGDPVCKPLGKSVKVRGERRHGEEFRTIHYPEYGYRLAFSPDGKYLVSGGASGPLCLWDLKSGEMLGEELGAPYAGKHDCGVDAISFLPDGNHFVTAGEREPKVYFWDLRSRRLVGDPIILGGREGRVTALDLSPDGNYLAIARENREITLWSTAERRQLGEALKAHTHRVVAVDFSPDGRLLAAGSEDGVVSMWYLKHLVSGLVKDGIVEWPLYTEREFPKVLSLSDDLKTVATTDVRCRSVQLWDVETGSRKGLEFVAAEEGKTISGGSINSDGTRLAISSGNSISFWDARTGLRAPASYEMKDGDVEQMLFRGDGTSLIARTEHSIGFWDTEKSRELLPQRKYNLSITSMAVDPTSNALALGATTRRVYLAPDIGRDFQSIFKGEYDAAYGLEFSGDGGLLAMTLGHNPFGTVRKRKLHRWDARSGRLIGVEFQAEGFCIKQTAISPDHAFIAANTCDGYVRVWDAVSGDLLGENEVGRVAAMKFSQDSGGLVMMVAGRAFECGEENATSAEGEREPDREGWDGTVEKIVRYDMRAMRRESSANPDLATYLVEGCFLVDESGLHACPATFGNLYHAAGGHKVIASPGESLVTLGEADVRRRLELLRAARNWMRFLDVYLEEGEQLSPGERTDMARFVITLAGMEARKEMSAHGDYIFDRIDRVMTEDMVASGELDLAILGLCESVVRIENKERGDDYWDKLMKRLLMLNPDARARCLEVMEASED